MKKIITFMLILCCITLQLPATTPANPEPVTSTTKVPSVEAQNMIRRLKEIESIDRSKLTRYEKKQLRKEVRLIDKQLRGISGGVYISVGTLILILVLLILLA